MENNPYVYMLSQKLEYSRDGDFFSTGQLEFKTPSFSDYKLSYKLSQLVMGALLDMTKHSDTLKNLDTKDKNKKTEDNMDSNTIKMMLMSSSIVDFSEIVDVCFELFSSVGTFDGKTSIKPAVLQRLPLEVITDIVCGYIANFIYPSLFSEGVTPTNGDT